MIGIDWFELFRTWKCSEYDMCWWGFVFWFGKDSCVGLEKIHALIWRFMLRFGGSCVDLEVHALIWRFMR